MLLDVYIDSEFASHSLSYQPKKENVYKLLAEVAYVS